MENSHSTQSRAWSSMIVIILIAAGAILSTSMGIRQSLGLFLGPVVAGTGVSVAAFGLVLAIQNIVWGAAQPFVGALADRFGGQMVVIVGAICYALGLWVMKWGTAAGLYLGGGILIGVAVAATSYGVLVGMLSRAAPPNVRNMAVSILAAVGSLGTFVIAPGAQWALDKSDWTSAIMILAAVAATMAVAAIALRGRRITANAHSAERPNALRALQMAAQHRGFVAMTIAFFACGFQLVFVATHLPNFLAFCGLPASLSATALALIGLFNAAGTLAAGKLGEVFGHKTVLAAIYLLRTAAIASYAFLPVSVESTLLFGAAMGLLWLSVVPPVSALINSLFGATNFGVLFGVMFFSHQIGAFFGAYLGGLTFDYTGDYTLAWILMVTVGISAAAIQFFMDDRPTVTLTTSR